METMTVTNSTLRQKFSDGNTSGENHTGSMHIEQLRNGDTALIGYDHCIYAERDSESGEITVHSGWRTWAKNQSENAEATPRHIRKLERIADATTRRNPSAASAPESVRDIGRVGFGDHLTR